MRVRLRRCGLLRGRDLGPQAREFRVQRGLVGQQRGEALVALAQVLLQLLQLGQSLPGDGRGRRQGCRIESQPRRGARAAGVGVREPVADVEEFPHRHQRVGLEDRALAVDGLIAEAGDQPGLGEDRLAGRRLEGRLVEQGAEVVLVGQPEGGVVLVGPGDRQFEGAAGVEAGGARVRVDRPRRAIRRVVDRRPFVLEECELVAHRLSPRRGRGTDPPPPMIRVRACHSAVSEPVTARRADTGAWGQSGRCRPRAPAPCRAAPSDRARGCDD